ncbi:hypothetical protein HK405_009574, partial [Cladochytrium tenue]
MSHRGWRPDVRFRSLLYFLAAGALATLECLLVRRRLAASKHAVAFFQRKVACSRLSHSAEEHDACMSSTNKAAASIGRVVEAALALCQT